MLQLLIIGSLALVLVVALTILLKQTFKQRRLLRKQKPDQDIRDQSNWAADYKKSYFKPK